MVCDVCILYNSYPLYTIERSALFIAKVKFGGTPMRIYSQGTLYSSAEVVVRVVTAFAEGGGRVKLSPSFPMPTKNVFLLHFGWVWYLGF